MTDAVAQQLQAQEEAALARTQEWLAIPSVSTDPDRAASIAEAADWVRRHLERSGLQTGIRSTAGHPAVVAASASEAVPAGAPTVLFYGHYDVQPPEPLDAWTTPPFEPAIRDGMLYARGACDDKGQVMGFLEAVRAFADSGEPLPCRVKVLIEGEEEVGSEHLPAFLETHREELAADVVLISDTSMWDASTPAITYGLRGLLYFDLQLHGPSRDLHSGVYGGTLANPAVVLTQVLGRLFDAHHRVTIPGFYDEVQPVEEQERQRWARLEFDEAAFLGGVGAKAFGEAGYTTLHRRWSRPACDINGLYGGYMSEGAKTVIPAYAGAKVSFRLADAQDPDRIAEAFRAWLESQPVEGLRWRITEHGRADPVAVATDSPWIAAADRALERAFGRRPVLVREGATLPVVARLKRELGADALLVGFGLEGDRIHSPDEHISLDRLDLARRTHLALLRELGNGPV